MTYEQWLRSFASETVLQHAIADLLNRTGTARKVQILQGSLEVGKDIVFYATGALGEEELCACVVKNTKITGAVDSNHGARTVMLQAEQTLDTPHVDEAGRAQRVSRVYVMTPYSVAPATVASISGKLAARPGQVVFVAGPRLYDLFNEHWAEYMLADTGGLRDTLAAASEEWRADGAILKVAQQYRLPVLSTDIPLERIARHFVCTVISYASLHLGTLIPSEERRTPTRFCS